MREISVEFGEAVEPYRRELLLHCYRMLGSLTDAEDVLQETLIAAWRGFGAFEGRASVRSWLYRIATNRCLNAIRDGRRRIPPAPQPPFQPPEPTRHHDVPWLQPLPEDRYDAREAVELAFIVALQRLPPRQAAVLLLCDVLGYATDEVAGMLSTTATAVKGLLQRARAALPAERSQPPAPGSRQERELAGRFADAFTADDIDALVTLLTDDAWLAMPPAPHEYIGTAAIAAFLRASAAWRAGRRFRLAATRANGQPAFDWYFMDRPVGVIVLTLAGNRISGITHFLDSDLLARLELS